MVSHNYEHDNDASGSFVGGLIAGLLAGLVLGGLVGAVVMLFMAPQSGKRTRAKLGRQSAALREQAAETVGDAVEQARDKAHQITQDIRKPA